MRAVLAVIAGVLAGMAAMMAVSFLGTTFFPLVAPPVSGSTIEQVSAAFSHATTGLKVSYVVAWFIGGVVAGGVAKLIAGSGGIAWTAIAILTVLTALNMFVLPYPVWMEIANVLAPLLGGLVGNHLVAARTDERLASAEG